MTKTSLFCGISVRWLVQLIACICLIFPAVTHSAFAQEVTLRDEEPIVITGEEVPSAYGAPPGLSRSRFSNVTQAYVLPPWSFFFGELFEGQGFRHGPPDYLFTQEIEMGLPYRFNVAAESQFERFNGGGGAQTVSLEARWALADWNKIPLNPTLFAEYKFDTKKFLLRQAEEEKKRKKRAARPKFPMPTKFVCSSPRNSSVASNGP
jgi:hypothetical protein